MGESWLATTTMILLMQGVAWSYEALAKDMLQFPLYWTNIMQHFMSRLQAISDKRHAGS